MFFGVQWANPTAFYLLPLFVLLIGALWFHHYRITKSLSLFVHPTHKKMLFPKMGVWRRRLKFFLIFVAFVFLFGALLRPQWGENELLIQQEGRDLVVLLDISRSMLAQDMKPDRLTFTKLKIRNLLSKLDAERVGLILFSGTAFIQCPLTRDYDAFLMFLDMVDAETISSGTTAVDAALKEAVKLFGRSEERKHKLVLLVTDGEDYSLNLDTIKRDAEKEGITLCALGIGTSAGAPIPLIDHRGIVYGHEKDEKGAIALTRLNEELLSSLVRTLHGIYVKASYHDNDLDQIVSFVSSFEQEHFGEKKMSLYQDQYPLFLAGTWLCLLLEWIL